MLALNAYELMIGGCENLTRIFNVSSYFRKTFILNYPGLIKLQS